MYSTIFCPKTSIKYNINSKSGKKILKKYINNYLGGSMSHRSYDCRLGQTGVNGVMITTNNCKKQYDPLGYDKIENYSRAQQRKLNNDNLVGDNEVLSRCNLTKSNVCRKRQSASIKRGKRNWKKLNSRFPTAVKLAKKKGVAIISKLGKKEEEAARQAMEEEEAARQAMEEEEAARQAMEEEEAARQAMEREEAARQAMEREEAARQAMEKEEAARQAMEEEEAASHAREREEIARQAMEEEEAASHAREKEETARQAMEEEAIQNDEDIDVNDQQIVVSNCQRLGDKYDMLNCQNSEYPCLTPEKECSNSDGTRIVFNGNDKERCGKNMKYNEQCEQKSEMYPCTTKGGLCASVDGKVENIPYWLKPKKPNKLLKQPLLPEPEPEQLLSLENVNDQQIVVSNCQRLGDKYDMLNCPNSEYACLTPEKECSNSDGTRIVFNGNDKERCGKNMKYNEQCERKSEMYPCTTKGGLCASVDGEVEDIPDFLKYNSIPSKLFVIPTIVPMKIASDLPNTNDFAIVPVEKNNTLVIGGTNQSYWRKIYNGMSSLASGTVNFTKSSGRLAEAIYNEIDLYKKKIIEVFIILVQFKTKLTNYLSNRGRSGAIIEGDIINTFGFLGGTAYREINTKSAMDLEMQDSDGEIIIDPDITKYRYEFLFSHKDEYGNYRLIDKVQNLNKMEKKATDTIHTIIERIVTELDYSIPNILELNKLFESCSENIYIIMNEILKLIRKSAKEDNRNVAQFELIIQEKIGFEEIIVSLRNVPTISKAFRSVSARLKKDFNSIKQDYTLERGVKVVKDIHGVATRTIQVPEVVNHVSNIFGVLTN